MRQLKTRKDFEGISKLIANPAYITPAVAYLTGGSTVAILRQNSSSTAWGFAYIAQCLSPTARAMPEVFKKSACADSIAAAVRAGRDVFAFTSSKDLIRWAAGLDLRSIDADNGKPVDDEDEEDAWEVEEEEAPAKKICNMIDGKTGKTHSLNYVEKQTMKFQMIPTLNGRNLDEVSTDEIITIIAKTEGEIEKLNNIRTQSTVIQSRVQKIKENLVELVNYIDKNRND